ncbi:hypothetical protein P5Y53_13670 [Dyella jiangningensis]|uniref:hypothetical protein n=1 Tax=Dyella jiangningensis TaxID=1379159 RepID=UPI00240F9341|nr:hypothetical protein [Dyella jiangningensis]MDG2538718.1 hypothetical protein [Dyella jiangningensis]
MNPRAELQKALNRIEGHLPRLLDELPDPADFWPAFAGEADAILEGAGQEHDWVADKLESMLAFHGAPAP